MIWIDLDNAKKRPALSIRGQAGSDDEVLIGGITVFADE